ncbi:Crp/Fnr family transcriptional regulator [Bradyrhizobium cenepequi]
MEILGTPRRVLQRCRIALPGERIVSCGDVSENVLFLCKGWAFRFLRLPDGGRQIFDFLLPGDIFSPTSVIDERFTFSVEALTEVQVGEVRRESLARQLTSPTLQSGWVRDFARHFRTTDELIVALGRRTAEDRVAYLILQLTRRMWRRNLTREHRFAFPAKLGHIADAVGLTPECVCRMLGRFRRRGVFTLSNGYLEILDFDELERVGSLRSGI